MPRLGEDGCILQSRVFEVVDLLRRVGFPEERPAGGAAPAPERFAFVVYETCGLLRETVVASVEELRGLAAESVIGVYAVEAGDPMYPSLGIAWESLRDQRGAGRYGVQVLDGLEE